METNEWPILCYAYYPTATVMRVLLLWFAVNFDPEENEQYTMNSYQHRTRDKK